MRISDWSSDVCSSDLKDEAGNALFARNFDGDRPHSRPKRRREEAAVVGMDEGALRELLPGGDRMTHDGADQRVHVGLVLHEIGLLDQFLRPWLKPEAVGADNRADRQLPRRDEDHRSEEHTYELPSLQRNSYAVF